VFSASVLALVYAIVRKPWALASLP